MRNPITLSEVRTMAFRFEAWSPKWNTLKSRGSIFQDWISHSVHIYFLVFHNIISFVSECILQQFILRIPSNPQIFVPSWNVVGRGWVRKNETDVFPYLNKNREIVQLKYSFQNRSNYFTSPTVASFITDVTLIRIILGYYYSHGHIRVF
jgi:hypothetical protein